MNNVHVHVFDIFKFQEKAETIVLNKREKGLGFSLLGQQDGKRIVHVSNTH